MQISQLPSFSLAQQPDDAFGAALGKAQDALQSQNIRTHVRSASSNLQPSALHFSAAVPNDAPLNTPSQLNSFSFLPISNAPLFSDNGKNSLSLNEGNLPLSETMSRGGYDTTGIAKPPPRPK